MLKSKSKTVKGLKALVSSSPQQFMIKDYIQNTCDWHRTLTVKPRARRKSVISLKEDWSGTQLKLLVKTKNERSFEQLPPSSWGFKNLSHVEASLFRIQRIITLYLPKKSTTEHHKNYSNDKTQKRAIQARTTAAVVTYVKFLIWKATQAVLRIYRGLRVSDKTILSRTSVIWLLSSKKSTATTMKANAACGSVLHFADVTFPIRKPHPRWKFVLQEFHRYYIALETFR